MFYDDEKNQKLIKAFIHIGMIIHNCIEEKLIPDDEEAFFYIIKINDLLSKFSKRMSVIAEEKNDKN